MKNKIIVSALLLAMSITTLGCKINTTPNVNVADRNKVTKKDSDDKNDNETKKSKSEDNEEVLSNTQRNSVNMLNYMTVLTQKINQSPNNQVFLEDAYSSLKNDLYPNAVDNKTQAQSTSLLDTINEYRMISVKRERLEYIYEQNKAQALRQAIPNPMGLLSAVQSGSTLKAAASILYMAVDAKSSYNAASSQADLQFLKDGWELDDQAADELHNSTKNALNYMYNMVRDYDLPGDYALNDESVEAFVSWTTKDNLVSKISWLESNQKTYEQFGPYWLELVKDYYDAENYNQCLDALDHYEKISTRIFRKDLDYAQVLPMAIISSRETMSEDQYVEFADKYCNLILSNTKKYSDSENFDWSKRYFVAQIYLDLYAKTNQVSYLESAYNIAFENVNVLADRQRELNKTYLAEVKQVEKKKGATKREKREVKEYNKALKNERKIALPPVNESLYLNCDLLFALADKLDIPQSEKNKIDSILHDNHKQIFLTAALDNQFWFDKKNDSIKAKDIDIDFNGKKLIIPATCITERSLITVSVKRDRKKHDITDWKVKEVVRPKNSKVSDFKATYESEEGRRYKYQDGDVITITIIPVEETPEEKFVFTFNTKIEKRAFIFNHLVFERAKK